MSADVLREAASLMRNRAAVAFDVNWHIDPHEPQRVLSGALYLGESSEDDIAAHWASWHPAVALAVADWLDSTADHSDAMGGHCVCDDAALAVARAYLPQT